MKVRIKRRYLFKNHDDIISMFDATNPEIENNRQRIICSQMEILNGQLFDKDSEDYDHSIMFFKARRSLIKIVNGDLKLDGIGHQEWIGDLDFQATLLEDVLRIDYLGTEYIGVLQGFTGTFDSNHKYVDAVQIRVEGYNYDLVFPLYAVNHII